MPRVVVIGAGAAGLAAAWQLTAEGCEVAVLEAGERAGGRAARAEVGGLAFDPTGGLFSSADRGLLALLAETGASDRLRALGPGGLAQVHRGRAASIDVSSRLGVARIPGVRVLDALRLVRLGRLLRRYRRCLDAEAPERGEPLDDRSLRDFATLYFGRSVADRFIGPLATAGTAQRPEDTSRLLYLLRAESHRAASPATLDGGVGAWLDELAGRLDVRLGAAVSKLEVLADGRLEVHFAAGKERADAVVVATPAPAALAIAGGALVPAERDFLGGVGHAPGLTLALGFERRPFDVPQRIQIPRAEGWPLESVALLPSQAAPGLPPAGGLVVATATAEWAARHETTADEVVAKDLGGVLARSIPAARSGASFARVTRFPAALPRFVPGHFRGLAHLRRVQADRRAEGHRLYLAGDYLAGPWLEAALGSGTRAARELLADLA